jgi:hypothetical protein
MSDYETYFIRLKSHLQSSKQVILYLGLRAMVTWYNTPRFLEAFVQMIESVGSGVPLKFINWLSIKTLIATQLISFLS